MRIWIWLTSTELKEFKFKNKNEYTDDKCCDANALNVSTKQNSMVHQIKTFKGIVKTPKRKKNGHVFIRIIDYDIHTQIHKHRCFLPFSTNSNLI